MVTEDRTALCVKRRLRLLCVDCLEKTMCRHVFRCLFGCQRCMLLLIVECSSVLSRSLATYIMIQMCKFQLGLKNDERGFNSTVSQSLRGAVRYDFFFVFFLVSSSLYPNSSSNSFSSSNTYFSSNTYSSSNFYSSSNSYSSSNVSLTSRAETQRGDAARKLPSTSCVFELRSRTKRSKQPK